jgi:hypothetical protein
MEAALVNLQRSDKVSHDHNKPEMRVKPISKQDESKPKQKKSRQDSCRLEIRLNQLVG